MGKGFIYILIKNPQLYNFQSAWIRVVPGEGRAPANRYFFDPPGVGGPAPHTPRGGGGPALSPPGGPGGKVLNVKKEYFYKHLYEYIF